MTKLLDELTIPVPCPVKWESMTGNEQVRDCSKCSRKVYNLSAMTESEAESFLLVNGTSECVQFYRRADGKIMTERCPALIRKIRIKARTVASFIASFFAAIITTNRIEAQTSPQTSNGDSVAAISNSELTPMDFANGAYGIVIGGIGTFGTVKHSDNKIQCGKEWHNPGWTKPENKNEAYKQYKKARTLRAKNKFDDAQIHYLRALELCARFSPGYGKTAVQIRKEMSEMANERKNSQATK